jgi:hypothetical protein
VNSGDRAGLAGRSVEWVVTRNNRTIARTLIGSFAVAGAAASIASGGAEMWNCAVGSAPGNTIVLVSMGPRSYVTLSGQRVPASVTQTGEERRWAWGANSIVLSPEGLARYYEGGDATAAKGTFRCRKMG